MLSTVDSHFCSILCCWFWTTFRYGSLPLPRRRNYALDCALPHSHVCSVPSPVPSSFRQTGGMCFSGSVPRLQFSCLLSSFVSMSGVSHPVFHHESLCFGSSVFLVRCHLSSMSCPLCPIFCPHSFLSFIVFAIGFIANVLYNMVDCDLCSFDADMDDMDEDEPGDDIENPEVMQNWSNEWFLMWVSLLVFDASLLDMPKSRQCLKLSSGRIVSYTYIMLHRFYFITVCQRVPWYALCRRRP